ncbi:D-glycero-beta-D-manno-heptose 1-phosphate adenylyltransferase [Formicincola oecophyllae]|uniref:Bifunctional protein HldE n=2 Tax=Formicincola oecophyllae TaxID=2558361 RepID=A0A4Y6UD25_9PROT|nr:D-glycero-beta-D-manno-heptose 1-phosphate adenylyltransferase [Formicincola oecophyllae]
MRFGTIAVVGDVILDRYLEGEVNRLSPEAPVPVLSEGRERARPGGAANVALNAAALGCQVRLVGLVGDDTPGRQLAALLAGARLPGTVSCAGLVVEGSYRTVVKTRVLAGRQQIVRIDEENPPPPFGAPRSSALHEAVRQALRGADVIVCSDYAKGVLGDDILALVMKEAQQARVPVIADPKRANLSAYAGAALLTPNQAELRQAVGMDSLESDSDIAEAALQASLQFGGDVLLTRSGAGMSLWRRDGTLRHAHSVPSEVYDVSGAGDTVIASMAAFLSGGLAMDDAMQLANIAAGLVVGKLGTASVSLAEIMAAFSQGQRVGMGRVPALGPVICHGLDERARHRLALWRQAGERIVFTNGCFDLLHPGHLKLLAEAATVGDRLVVGLNSNDSVARLKGKGRPIQDEKARAAMLAAMRGVDMVVVFGEDTPEGLIRALKPDVLVKGDDYREEDIVGADFVKSQGGLVVRVPVLPGQSTSNLASRAGSTQG